MHHLYLRSFGPVKECSIDIFDCIVITGAQATGKSTIAKAVYYFETVKDDIIEILMQRSSISNELTLINSTIRHLRNKFLQMFGSSRAMSNDMKMRYEYTRSTYIEISLRTEEGKDYISPNYIYFDFSRDIEAYLRDTNRRDIDFFNRKDIIVQEISELFDNEYETIFIPAGRSLITLLTSQINYIFTMMNDDQKRSLDYTTQKYIERILKIRSLFTEGIWGYYEAKESTSIAPLNKKVIREAMTIVNRILKGEYRFVSGEERLNMDNGRFVKLNYISSGQQESVWIFNILLYQLINNTKSFIILEEPEAHLYPDSQKDIIELLTLFKNAGNSLLITTHSPYLLGAMNNLLYAHTILTTENKSEVDRIVQEELRLTECHAYYIKEGNLEDCFDRNIHLIDNGVIDGASHVINETFDKLTDIEERDKHDI